MSGLSDSKPTIAAAVEKQLARLGKNISGYFGETIAIGAVLEDCLAAARHHGWMVEELPVTTDLRLLTLSRPARSQTPTAPSQPPTRVYISTGIHGDEPAGPLAIRQLLQADAWPREVSLWLCPCLNPTGFRINRRENAAGVDLNRDYLQPKAAETVAHISWLERQPAFDLSLCLHEDWESAGFYAYELNPDNRPSLAESIVASVAAICPVDRSELIEGRPAVEGVIRPNLDPRTRPQWPESFFLISHKSRLSYTLEAPSDFPLVTRVTALVQAVETALKLVTTR